MNREELIAEAVDVLRHCTPYVGASGGVYVDEDRQKAALDALLKGRVTEDAVAFVNNMFEREHDIAMELCQPDPMGFQSEKDRQSEQDAAYRAAEHYSKLADQLEELI